MWGTSWGTCGSRPFVNALHSAADICLRSLIQTLLADPTRAANEQVPVLRFGACDRSPGRHRTSSRRAKSPPDCEPKS